MKEIAKLVSVKLEPEVLAKVKELAQSRQRTAHWIMREAITQYVNNADTCNTSVIHTIDMLGKLQAIDKTLVSKFLASATEI